MQSVTAFYAYFDMVQHQLFLCIVHGAVRAFEHGNFMTDNMLVEVGAEQGLQSEYSITHGTFVDRPKKKKRQTSVYVKGTVSHDSLKTRMFPESQLGRRNVSH